MNKELNKPDGTIIEFLLGEKPFEGVWFEGVWFGDVHSSNLPFWWRKHLRQWQLEQKQVVSDEEIEKMAEKEYPIWETIKGNKVSGHILGYQHAMKTGFIKGFKSALQYTAK